MSTSQVIVNKVQLSDQEVAALEQRYGVRIQTDFPPSLLVSVVI
jgi:hypothetical protein